MLRVKAVGGLVHRRRTLYRARPRRAAVALASRSRERLSSRVGGRDCSLAYPRSSRAVSFAGVRTRLVAFFTVDARARVVRLDRWTRALFADFDIAERLGTRPVEDDRATLRAIEVKVAAVIPHERGAAHYYCGRRDSNPRERATGPCPTVPPC